MSQENVELVENLLQGSSNMDRDELLAALPQLIAAICAPDVEWVEDPRRADGRAYVGHAAVLGSWQRWLEQWDRYGFEIEEVLDCGDEVLVCATERARGAGSGASVEARLYALIGMRDGKVARYREFTDGEDARRAAGIGGVDG